MALYERLTGFGLVDGVGKISVHSVMAVLAERKRGKLTNADVIAAFGLTAAEQTELLALYARVNNNQVTAVEVHDVLLMAESGIYYDTVANVKTRFGVT